MNVAGLPFDGRGFEISIEAFGPAGRRQRFVASAGGRVVARTGISWLGRGLGNVDPGWEPQAANAARDIQSFVLLMDECGIDRGAAAAMCRVELEGEGE